jgi:hypothetical protein
MTDGEPMNSFKINTLACGIFLFLFAAVDFAAAQVDIPADIPDEMEDASDVAGAQLDGDDETSHGSHSRTPDLRGEDHPLIGKKGNFLVVPIPLSNPSLGSGLVLGAAYFYAQSGEQKKTQPASVTALAVMKTSNDSTATILGHEQFWGNGKWRAHGAAGTATLNLELLAPDPDGLGLSSEWLIDGNMAYADVLRRITGKWYAGIQARYVDFDQDFTLGFQSVIFDAGSHVTSAGLGVMVENDTRDNPFNPYQGRFLKFTALVNDTSLGSDRNYRSYNVEYSQYHKLSAPVVLAWELLGCHKDGRFIPLWDACRIHLRGFPGTDFMGRTTASAQVEARWKVFKHLGLVGFAGTGYYENSFSNLVDNDLVPSYGVGLRWMVLAAQRVNMSLDFGWSDGSNAYYVSVGEYF